MGDIVQEGFEGTPWQPVGSMAASPGHSASAYIRQFGGSNPREGGHRDQERMWTVAV